MQSHKDPIGIVEQLYSDDCLAVSDSRGTRNIQSGDYIYLDDEIISGSIQVINKIDSGLEYSFFDLVEDEEVLAVINSNGIKLPEGVLDGLFGNDLRDFSSISSSNS